MFLVLAALSMNGARATSIDNFEMLRKSNPQLAEAYMLGVGNGLSWANSALEQRSDTPLFCPPSDVRFTYRDYIEISEQQLSALKRSNMIVPGMPIDFVLYLGLAEKYPCRSS